MATSTSSCPSRAASDEAARREETSKLRAANEKLRLESASLNKALDLERSGIRALKAQHEAELRRLKTQSRKREEALEKQLRNRAQSDRSERPPELGFKKLCAEIQALKATNKTLQESLETAQQSTRDATHLVRAREAQHAARIFELDKQSRTQTHRLLEEIKSKDRVISQLKKSTVCQQCDKAQRMEADSHERLKLNNDKERSTDHMNEDKRAGREEEIFYRETSDMDSAVSSAPTSLSPQPHGVADMWGCAQCRAANSRAEERARECTRLSDALRDARDQLELLEFRLLELEDAAPDKCARDNLTDSDSGCVSPGSRLQDSASPVLRRTDSGYKSPSATSPATTRKLLNTAGMSDRLHQMLENCCSSEERECLQQVLTLLHDLHILSIPEAEMHQLQTKKIYTTKSLSKLDAELSVAKSPKIATVSPYSQNRRSLNYSSLESLCDEPRKISILQESGIFDEVETDEKSTQTEVYESLECGDLNTEIQRLNSIREKLEKRGVSRNKTLKEEEGLECRCVKLGKRHKQYYERRLKFLEGKISIYEAAPDVKKAKLAQRLQNEFVLENRVQDLESQLCALQEKCERLEEECCELEELENDTRLHAQQLETECELARDMAEQRDCSRTQAEKLVRALQERENILNKRAKELTSTLQELEKAVPALIAYNVVRALGTNLTSQAQEEASSILGSLAEQEELVSRLMEKKKKKKKCMAVVVWKKLEQENNVVQLTQKIAQLTGEKNYLETQAAKQREALEKQIRELRVELKEASNKLHKECELLDDRIKQLDGQLTKCRNTSLEPPDPATGVKLRDLIETERTLSARVRELERREAAYLEMLSQADEMWAEMEGGYQKKIKQADSKVGELQREMANIHAQTRRKVSDLEQSETALRVGLEKAERDTKRERSKNKELEAKLAAATSELNMTQTAFKKISDKYKQEMKEFRQKTASMIQQLEIDTEAGKQTEEKLNADLERTRKDLARTCRNVQDLEVTTSELKEEVESLENQLALMQKAIIQCRRKCDDKVKTISRELSLKTEELEELRSDIMRQSLRPSLRKELRDCNECNHDTSQRYNYMHRSLSYETRCCCPAIRSRLVGSLIEDLFERIHNTTDEDLEVLSKDLECCNDQDSVKAKITNYLLMAISKELVRSIGDADAKADTQEWRTGEAAAAGGNARVLRGARRLASVACACAATRLCAARPGLTHAVNTCQQEVLENGDVKIMEEQLASAIESIVNCPSCALGTDAIVWSTDV